jgi:hypothetical protein
MPAPEFVAPPRPFVGNRPGGRLALVTCFH